MPRTATYDWDSWFQIPKGRKEKSITLISGKDFKVPLRSFVALAHQIAGRRGLRIETESVLVPPKPTKNGKLNERRSIIPAYTLTITITRKKED